jgi:hypothetical protein
MNLVFWRHQVVDNQNLFQINIKNFVINFFIAQFIEFDQF